MSNMAEGHDRCAHQREVVPSSCTPQLSHRCSLAQTRLPVDSPLRPSTSDHHTEQDEDSGGCQSEMQSNESPPSSRFYEELFCTSQALVPLVPLAGALLASTGPQTDVVKEGYLGKLEQNHRRYFVLREGSHTGPSRLEWYKTQEKFTGMEKSAGKVPLFGSNKQGVIYLRCCLGVSRVGSSRKGHTVALYDQAQTLVLVMEDQQLQEEWYIAIKKLMEQDQKDEEHVEGVDEDDDGYCTLPPAAFFKEVWPVTVKPRGLGISKPFTGENRLCLTATTLVLVRLGANNDFPSVTIPLLSVRRFGHLDGFFFLELGRSAPNGPGEIWMEAREEGNAAMAQHIHEAVRETVRALRALPDFSRSPTSSNNQQPALQASKRSRPKYRDKLVNVRSITPLVLHSRIPDSQASPTKCPRRLCKPDDRKSESSLSFTSHHSPSSPQQSSEPDTNSYTETQTDHSRGTACRVLSWESAEKEEGLGYMIMSPQVTHSLSELAQDDYVIMESPQKPSRPAYSSSSSSSSLQTSFSSSTCDSFSPLDPSHHNSQPNFLESSVRHSETENDQSQEKISCSVQALDDEQRDQNSAQMKTEDHHDRSVLIPPFDLSGSGCTRAPLSRPNFDKGQSSQPQAEEDQSPIRRYWLSTCLLSCLHTENRS